MDMAMTRIKVKFLVGQMLDQLGKDGAAGSSNHE
jgi:hypothetical protein